jgi:cytidylate kinase
MPVITISRELGSRGDEVAVAVAERLGLRLVDREIINRAARAAGAPEVALAEIDQLGLLGLKPTAAAFRSYREKIGEFIGELADAGDLLLIGRGGQVVLAGRPSVLHVRIRAPKGLRVQAVSTASRISLDAAAARVDAVDRVRAGFLRRCYGVPWDAPDLYDIVLNTARLGVEAAADLICLAARRRAAEEATGRP